jgi:hypothetical protein
MSRHKRGRCRPPTPSDPGNSSTTSSAISDADQKTLDFSTWLRHAVQQDDFDQPDDGILFEIIRRAIDELDHRITEESSRHGSKKRTFDEEVGGHVGEADRIGDGAHVSKKVKVSIEGAVDEPMRNGDTSSDDEDSSSNDESETIDDDSFETDQVILAHSDTADHQTDHDFRVYAGRKRIPRIDDDVVNTFAVRELLPDDDRTLLVRRRPLSQTRAHMMQFWKNIDKNEVIEAINAIGTHKKDKRAKLHAPTSIQECKLGFLTHWSSAPVAEAAFNRHCSIKKKCSLSILPLRPAGIVDAIINDAGDLSAEQITTALLEKFGRKCFTLGHAFHRGRSSDQYWVRFGYIIYPLPLTLPVRSAPDETPSFTVQPANLETCDICKLPRSQRSCECQVQLIAHEDVCSEIDGYALRKEVRRQEKIVRRARRRDLSLLWARIRAHPEYRSSEDELLHVWGEI